MDKYPSPILVVLFDPMILPFIILLQRAQNEFLELAASLAGNDLNAFGLFVDRFLHDLGDRLIELVAFGKDVMKIKFKIHSEISNIQGTPS